MSLGPITRFPITLDVRTLERAEVAAAAEGLTIPDFVSRLVSDTLAQRQMQSPEDVACFVSRCVDKATRLSRAVPPVGGSPPSRHARGERRNA